MKTLMVNAVWKGFGTREIAYGYENGKSERLLRLPMYYCMGDKVYAVIDAIKEFYK